MIINDIEFNASLWDILTELRSQLQTNGINLLGSMKQSGHNIQVCCPYHNERRPSAGIDMNTGIFHCFACQEVRSLEEVISHCFGYENDFVFGWNWLLKNFLTISIEERKIIPLDLDRNVLYNVSESKEYVSDEELDKYRYIHPYMYKRGLTDEVIETFDIGYDKDTRCITFPVRDKSGGTLFIARRSVNSKFFNYPKEAEKSLYGLYELYQQRTFPSEIIITESMLDALSFWTVQKYAVALNGLGNELQFRQLRELPCRMLILCTDMDEAGMKARARIKKNVTNKIITEYILPEGRKDANECTPEELKRLEKEL